MKTIKTILTLLMMLVSLSISAQLRTIAQTDFARQAEYREKIGIDMSIPNFDTKKIEAKVMGGRLVGNLFIC